MSIRFKTRGKGAQRKKKKNKKKSFVEKCATRPLNIARE